MPDNEVAPSIEELSKRINKTLQRPEVRLMIVGAHAQKAIEWMIDYLEKNDPSCPSIFVDDTSDPQKQTRILDLKMLVQDILVNVGADPKKEMQKITKAINDAVCDVLKDKDSTVH